MKVGLNDAVKKLIPKVEYVFLFDDDDNDLLLYSCLIDPKNPKANIKSEVGMLTLTKNMTAQVSVYEMPNGKCCAVCYPCSVRVDHNKFDSKMHELFENVDRWAGNSYAFFLFCLKNGYESMIKEK